MAKASLPVTVVVPLELPIEAAGDLLGVERAAHPFKNRGGRERRFLGNRERRPPEPLQDRLGRGAEAMAVGNEPVAHPAWALLGPQPQALMGRGEHHQLIPAHTAQLSNQTVLAGPQRQPAGAVDPERGHAPLVGHCGGRQSAVGHADRIVVPRMVPAHLPDEQTREVTRPQAVTQTLRAAHLGGAPAEQDVLQFFHQGLDIALGSIGFGLGDGSADLRRRSLQSLAENA